MRRHRDNSEAIAAGDIRAGHAQVPERFCQGEGGGLYLSLEVNNVDEIWKRAREAGADTLKPPGHDDYDRRNLVLRDPAGTVLEVFTPGDPHEAELSEYARCMNGSHRSIDGQFIARDKGTIPPPLAGVLAMHPGHRLKGG